MKAPYEKKIEDDLRSLQHEVDGSIEAIYPFEEEVALICNEEGKLNGLPLNRALRGEDGEIYEVIAGTFLLAGLTEDSFGSLPDEDMKKFSEFFQKPEVFLNYDGHIMALPIEVEPSSKEESRPSRYHANDSAYLKAALTNLGKYNEGELVYKWISLPISDEDLSKVLKDIGIDSKEYEEYFITDYDCEISAVYSKLGEYTSIRDLNALAERFELMSSHELNKFKAIMEGFGAADCADMINITHNLDCWGFLPDVTNHYDLGWYWVEESGCYNTKGIGNLANYIDYEGFGRDIALEECGQFTNEGYIYPNGNTIDKVYDPMKGYDEANNIVAERMLEEER